MLMVRLTVKPSNNNSPLMSYSFRFANENDIPFLVETIIAAEKSGTELCGLSNLLGLHEEQTKIGLTKILQEEIEGCEFSTTEFAAKTTFVFCSTARIIFLKSSLIPTSLN